MSGAVVAETIRRHLSSRGYAAYAFFMALTALLASSFNTPGSLWPPLVSLLAMITGSAIIGPEFSTGTLQLIVSKPLRRSTYVVSRVAGVTISVAIASLVPFFMECAGRLIFGGRSIPWERLIAVLGCELTVAMLIIAMLTLLGSVTRAYYNAAIYIGTQAAFTVGLSILGVMHVRRGMIGDLLTQHPEIELGIAKIEDVLFAGMPAELSGMWFLRVLATAAVAVAIACVAFERREVPYASE